jgi:tetratricopeptide (TPR) repeat protein
MAQTAEGDRWFARRAEGSSGATARTAPIDRAIAAYQRAVADDPENVEAVYKLLRATRFKAAYVPMAENSKRKLLSDARTVGDAGIEAIGRRLASRRIDVWKAPEREVAAAARTIRYAAELFHWDAAIWGEWALAYGKMAAVREGAAARIRRSATIATMIDPKADAGGGPRLLGRLHHQTPRVPLLTGWASKREAVRYLEQALAAAPTSKLTQLFLAEALFDLDSRQKGRAVELLRRVIDEPILDPEWRVEDEAARLDAAALLKRIG